MLNAQLVVPKMESNKKYDWKTAKKKNGPWMAPIGSSKQAHDILDHTNTKIVEWFRSEYPDAMEFMENSQHHSHINLAHHVQ